jgi:hypothetical protein
MSKSHLTVIDGWRNGVETTTKRGLITAFMLLYKT